ncbi:hypothetical protein [Streptomyces sp. NPDC088847]|uniref:arsenate reductase/protein-tyrosine-phosphatase family protein n=1 Tax=Streptomyces sp. NPDC088847 TaxID=3365909 RepID=UPI0037F35679
MPRRVLVVCLGNICRSPLGGAVLARRGGTSVEVRTAGLRDKWTGHGAHPMMTTAAAARGYDLSAHRGPQIDRDLIRWADTMLAMDRAVLKSVLSWRWCLVTLRMPVGLGLLGPGCAMR